MQSWDEFAEIRDRFILDEATPNGILVSATKDGHARKFLSKLNNVPLQKFRLLRRVLRLELCHVTEVKEQHSVPHDLLRRKLVT